MSRSVVGTRLSGRHSRVVRMHGQPTSATVHVILLDVKRSLNTEPSTADIASHSLFTLTTPVNSTTNRTGSTSSNDGKSAKRCRACGVVKPALDFYKNATYTRKRDATCRQCRIVMEAKRRQDRTVAGLCQKCQRPRDDHRVTCAVCRQRDQDYYSLAQSAVIDHYGGRCVCCGEVHWSFLTLDHINNDGCHQRRAGFRGEWHRVWALSKKLGWPTDLQLLCGNCQLGKLRGKGVCPHSKRQAACKRGHRMVGQNVYIAPDGERVCRACLAIRSSDWRQRHKIGRGVDEDPGPPLSEMPG